MSHFKKRTNTTQSSTSTDVLCNACQQKCDLKISTTSKNPGKVYYACPKKCKVFNGWFDGTLALSESQPRKVSKPKQQQPKVPSCPLCQQDCKRHLCPQTGLIVLTCVKCNVNIDVSEPREMPPLEDLFEEQETKTQTKKEPGSFALIDPTTNAILKNTNKLCSVCGLAMATGVSNSVQYGDEFYFCLNHKQQFGGWK